MKEHVVIHCGNEMREDRYRAAFRPDVPDAFDAL